MKRLLRIFDIGINEQLSDIDSIRLRFFNLDLCIIALLLSIDFCYSSVRELPLISIHSVVKTIALFGTIVALWLNSKHRFYLATTLFVVVLISINISSYYSVARIPVHILFFFCTLLSMFFFFYKNRTHFFVTIGICTLILVCVPLEGGYEVPEYNAPPTRIRLAMYLMAYAAFIYKLGSFYVIYESVLNKWKKEKTRYKQLFDTNPIGIAEGSPIKEVNIAFCKMLGYTKEEIRFKRPSEITAKEDQKETKKLIGKLRKREIEYFEIEKSYYRKDKSIMHAKTRVQGIYDEVGNCVSQIATIIDITKEKETEKKLREREQVLQAVINNIPFGIYWKNNNLKYLGCNQIYAGDLNMTIEEVKGKDCYDVTTVEHADFFTQLYKNVLKTGLPKKNIVIEADIPNGKKLYLRFNLMPLLTETQETFGIVGTYENITKEREQAIQTEVYQQKLEESEKKYRDIFDNAQHAIVIMNPENGNIIDCNWHTPQMFGYESKEKLLSLPLGVHRKLPEMDLHTAHQEVMQILQTVFKGKSNQFYEEVLTRKDGSIFDIEFNAVRHKSEEQQQLILFVRDVTERKLKEKELLKAKEQAEQSDRLKSAFLANMSHEIRTPMNGIVGFSSILLEEQLEEQKKQEYTEIIHDCCNQLLNIVNNVLDLAKIQTDALEIHEESVELNSLLQETLNLFQLEAAKKQLLVTADFPMENLYISTDGIKLRQIITNLLSNAIKFTKAGSIRLTYEIKNKQVQIAIQDTGIGISAADQVKIFERFQRIEQTAYKVRGAGLGLSICKGFAEALGGDLTLVSEVGKGSIFYVQIPYKTSAKQQQKRLRTTVVTTEYLEGKTILIAEDEVFNFKLLERLLQKQGVHILWAKNGQEAIQMVQVHTEIDLILMDMKMPVMNGAEATKWISQNTSIPIIAQSAHAFQEEQRVSLDIGCVAHITKPIQRQELMAAILKFVR